MCTTSMAPARSRSSAPSCEQHELEDPKHLQVDQESADDILAAVKRFCLGSDKILYATNFRFLSVGEPSLGNAFISSDVVVTGLSTERSGASSANFE